MIEAITEHMLINRMSNSFKKKKKKIGTVKYVQPREHLENI